MLLLKIIVSVIVANGPVRLLSSQNLNRKSVHHADTPGSADGT